MRKLYKKICSEWTNLIFYFPWGKKGRSVLRSSSLYVEWSPDIRSPLWKSLHTHTKILTPYGCNGNEHVVQTVHQCTFLSPKRKVLLEREHLLSEKWSTKDNQAWYFNLNHLRIKENWAAVKFHPPKPEAVNQFKYQQHSVWFCSGWTNQTFHRYIS